MSVLVLFQCLKEVRKLEPQKRSYCITCNKLLLPKEPSKDHKSHSVFAWLQKKQLKQPSKLIPPIVNKHAEVQFLMKPSCIGFLVDCILDLKQFDCVVHSNASALRSVEFKAV